MLTQLRAALLLAVATGLQIRQHAPSLNRRTCIAGVLSASTLPLLGAPAAKAVEEEIDVYFGCGCFWHVQHEFVEAERTILNRGDMELTSYTGYGGGTAGSVNGKVCYHNAMQVADYGKLGHAEAVGMRIPPSQFGLIAEEYCKLFSKDGLRPDQLGDRGTEYRNVVGVPGGVNSPYAKELVAASVKQGDKLDFAAGKGDDADRRGLVWIYDTAKYPFYLGEVYHQFHDGFAFGEDYPKVYNDLSAKKVKAGQLRDAGCPNGMLGVGIAGL
jgi:peptide methionine sulfoxide reductase MsrA